MATSGATGMSEMSERCDVVPERAAFPDRPGRGQESSPRVAERAFGAGVLPPFPSEPDRDPAGGGPRLIPAAPRNRMSTGR